MMKPLRYKRISNQVGGTIGRRESDGNEEVCSRESQQTQNKDFSGPIGKKPLQHRDAALAVWALLRHSAVNGICSKQRHENQYQSGDWRERSSGQKRNPRL